MGLDEGPEDVQLGGEVAHEVGLLQLEGRRRRGVRVYRKVLRVDKGEAGEVADVASLRGTKEEGLPVGREVAQDRVQRRGEALGAGGAERARVSNLCCRESTLLA